MSEPSSQAAESRDPNVPVTGDSDVDAILADFVEVQTELERSAAADDERPASGGPSADSAHQDRLASTVHAAEQAHRRLQDRLSADRE